MQLNYILNSSSANGRVTSRKEVAQLFCAAFDKVSKQRVIKLVKIFIVSQIVPFLCRLNQKSDQSLRSPYRISILANTQGYENKGNYR